MKGMTRLVLGLLFMFGGLRAMDAPVSEGDDHSFAGERRETLTSRPGGRRGSHRRTPSMVPTTAVAVPTNDSAPVIDPHDPLLREALRLRRALVLGRIAAGMTRFFPKQTCERVIRDEAWEAAQIYQGLCSAACALQKRTAFEAAEKEAERIQQERRERRYLKFHERRLGVPLEQDSRYVRWLRNDQKENRHEWEDIFHQLREHGIPFKRPDF